MAISRAQTGKQLSGSKKNRKVRTVMSEYKKGKLRSGSKKGPKKKVFGYGKGQQKAAARYAKKTGQKVKSKKAKTKKRYA